jgi:hypothetical protein
MKIYDATQPDLGRVRAGEPRRDLAEDVGVTSVRVIEARRVDEIDGG